MAWIFLVLAGIEEVVSVVAMQYIDGLKRKWPIVIMTFGFLLSFFCLSKAMQVLSPGIAYAVWTGIGSVGITLVGLIWFKEKYSAFQFVFLGFMIIGVLGLRLTA